jgi:hypothetical protein
LKKSFAAGFEDGIVAVVEGQFDLDVVVVFEFGRAGAADRRKTPTASV